MSTAVFFGIIGCKKFEDFQTDPNKTTQATPDLLLPTIVQAAFNEVSTEAALASRQLVYTDGVSNQQYYGWQRGSFNDYNHLRQVARMQAEAQRTGKPLYAALAKFFKAYFGLRLTLTFGDVPYSQALKGDEGIYTSAYDGQETIFASILTDLEEANAALAAGNESLQGDIVYNGDVQKWRKLVNTFTLRVLMLLSKKEANASLRVKERFAAMVNNPSQYPVFTSNIDNAKLTFYDIQGNHYPYFNNNAIQTAYYMEESFVTRLQNLQDPRLFRFAAKAPKHASLPETDFAAYGGVKGSATISENTTRVVAGEASKIHARYYNSAVNEPSAAVSFAELQFILAEAVLRGWISGNAENYYKNGIRASMEFYGIDAAAIHTYLQQPAVQLTVDNNLEAVLTQKHIASFMQNGWLSFYEQRRTGFPHFDITGGGVLNNGKIPLRWMYPETEMQLNRENVSAAISRQFAQGDDVNGVMWLLK